MKISTKKITKCKVTPLLLGLPWFSSPLAGVLVPPRAGPYPGTLDPNEPTPAIDPVPIPVPVGLDPALPNPVTPGPTPPKPLVPRLVLVNPDPPNTVLPSPPERLPVPPKAVFNDPVTPDPVLPHLVLGPTPLALGNAGPVEPVAGHGMFGLLSPVELRPVPPVFGMFGKPKEFGMNGLLRIDG